MRKGCRIAKVMLAEYSLQERLVFREAKGGLNCLEPGVKFVINGHLLTLFFLNSVNLMISPELLSLLKRLNEEL